ncbi:MAG TPA: CaiB/BaiF CoA-transferase family protein [Burkholderiaceae bacterium]|nr:CaiB/BaiF CoA-transferase family protein [Burkholderiaceae bacterium]
MGPLSDLKIIELAGIGPGPMAATVLADMGATVLRIDRTVPADLGVPKGATRFNLLRRSRETIALDLKDPRAIELVLDLVGQADALIEGFRPGVTERLGLGPEVCLARNPRLVYGRMTGWGQTGPLAQAAGHDINYIAITGVLEAIGRKDQPPSVPLALMGDMAGGAMYLVAGILAALHETSRSGHGQVVDAAIAEGAAALATAFYGSRAAGRFNLERGTNVIDSGAAFYDVYECADGRYISIGPIEAKFHRELLQRLGLAPDAFDPHLDPAQWPRAREAFTQIFRTSTRQAWCELLEGTDVCFAPVLNFDEAPSHPHFVARGSFVDVDGVVQPMPAPRFSRTPSAVPRTPVDPARETFARSLQGWLPNEAIARWDAAFDAKTS